MIKHEIIQLGPSLEVILLEFNLFVKIYCIIIQNEVILEEPLKYNTMTANVYVTVPVRLSGFISMTCFNE